MGYCKDCKWWEPMDEHSGPCNKQHEKDALVWVEMYDRILTAPNFGCIQFEAK